MTLLAVRDLVVRYGRRIAVNRANFSVERGQIVALIGPNGAGKTTCFNALNGQHRPSAGSVFLDGREVVGMSPSQLFHRGVGRTFQITATVGSMTVRENVQMGLISHHGRSSSVWKEARRLYRRRADELLAAVGMQEAADRPCGLLAYGDLKRLELGIALVNNPRLLLMDEPTAGMAPAERRALMSLAATLARQRDSGILFTEHDMDIVFEHADRVLVLHHGETILTGTPEEIRGNDLVREIYLGSDSRSLAAASIEQP